MSKTKRKTARREYEGKPLERHIPKRRCESCGEWFPEEDVSQDRDEAGRTLGWFCGGCI